MSWVEVDGAGRSWVELDGAWWSWVHGSVIPIHYIKFSFFYIFAKIYLLAYEMPSRKYILL